MNSGIDNSTVKMPRGIEKSHKIPYVKLCACEPYIPVFMASVVFPDYVK